MHVMDRRLLLLQQIAGTTQVGLQINKVSITRKRKAAVHGYKSQVTEGLVVHTEKKTCTVAHTSTAAGSEPGSCGTHQGPSDRSGSVVGGGAARAGERAHEAAPHGAQRRAPPRPHRHRRAPHRRRPLPPPPRRQRHQRRHGARAALLLASLRLIN